MAKIAVLSGDGIGPEIVREAVKVLQHVGALFGIPLTFEEGIVGGAAINRDHRSLLTRELGEQRHTCHELGGKDFHDTTIA